MTKHKDRTILVTGATGKQGGAVLHHLKERGFPTRALTRDANQPSARALTDGGTDVFTGNLDDLPSLSAALDGVYGAFSVQTFTGDTDAEVREGTNVAEAAEREQVSHLVYSSVGSADQNTGIPHFDTKAKIEEKVRNTGVPYTILRPVFFMENWRNLFGGQIAEGLIPLPLSPETRLQMIALDDIGAAAALAFEHEGKWHNKAVGLAGDELSMSQIAERFTRVTAREVKYQQIPWEAFEAQAGHETTVMFRWFENVGYSVDIASLRSELPQLHKFDRWLDLHWRQAGAKGA